MWNDTVVTSVGNIITRHRRRLQGVGEKRGGNVSLIEMLLELLLKFLEMFLVLDISLVIYQFLLYYWISHS